MIKTPSISEFNKNRGISFQGINFIVIDLSENRALFVRALVFGVIFVWKTDIVII